MSVVIQACKVGYKIHIQSVNLRVESTKDHLKQKTNAESFVLVYLLSEQRFFE